MVNSPPITQRTRRCRVQPLLPDTLAAHRRCLYFLRGAIGTILYVDHRSPRTFRGRSAAAAHSCRPDRQALAQRSFVPEAQEQPSPTVSPELKRTASSWNIIR